MDTQDNFALLLPVIQASLGIVFVLLNRAGVRTATQWGLAYLLSATAIAVYAIPLHPVPQTLLSDALFLGSYYLFGEAILRRYGPSRWVFPRLAIVALAFGADIYAVALVDSLGLSILAIDLGISLLLGLACLVVWRHLRKGIDLAIGACALLSVLTNAAMALLNGVVAPLNLGVAEFLASDYAFQMQFFGGVFSIWFGLAALAAVSFDVLAKYRTAANQDPLTGLLNRRGFDAAADALQQGKRGGIALVCDLDRFKAINDRFGHDAGDLVLRGVADILRSILPEQAVVARFGGEEFVALVPGASLSEGGALAHAVRIACAGHDWRIAGVAQQVTLCIGVAELAGNGSGWRVAINRADTALYAAKDDGRNQVMFASGDAVRPVSRSASVA